MDVGKPDDDVVRIADFKGLRNTVGPESFEDGDLALAQNVDVTDAGRVRRRKGYAAALFAGAYDSLYAAGDVMVARAGTNLQRLLLDGTQATLRAGLTGPRLSYDNMGQRIYYSDGLVTGCIDGGVPRTWGLDSPSSQPVATLIGGDLTVGRYEYAVTYMRQDGQESGTGVSGVLELTDRGGISFAAIPVSADPTVTAKRLYVSPANGDKMYHVMTLAAAAGTATYQHNVTGGAPLTTQFLQPPIAGQIVLVHHGRAFVARGKRAHYTDPYKPELMDIRKTVQMASYVTLMGEVDDGVYIGTADEVVFLGGDTPEKWEYEPKLLYGAILGAVAPCNAEDIDPSLDGIALLVSTTQGVCACLNGGKIINLTKSRFQYPATQAGAAIARSHGGMSQYLMVLEGSESAANTAF